MSWFRSLLSTRALHADLGLFLLRIGVGVSMLAFHGWGKLTGGPDRWAKIGSNMSELGIDFWPTAWGLMAALAETLGSALIIAGVLTRPAAAALAFTMLVAALRHLGLPDVDPRSGWSGASHALELLACYLALLLVGPGRWTIWPRAGKAEA